MKHFRLSFLVLTLLTCAACTHKQGKRADNETDSTALHIAVLPTMECLPLYVAEADGLFDSLGVNVRLTTCQSAMDADTAFCNHRCDGNMTDLVKATVWRSQGDSIRVVLAARLRLALITAQQARIRSAESLKEKIIAITRNSALDYRADQLLAAVNMQSEQLNKPQINNIALRAQMVSQNQYDGAFLPEPYATLCADRGACRVPSPRTLKNTDTLAALVFHEQTLGQRRDDVRRVLQAYGAAVSHINRQRETQAAELLSLLPMPEPLPDSIAAVPSFDPPTMPSEDTEQAIREWARGRSLMKNPVPLSELIDSTFIR